MSKRSRGKASSTKLRSIARRRLARDLVELQRANILSVAAHPIDDNIFEWHVNIKPTDGVYSGVYFHLIMIFPDSYPSNPPTVRICTPISHPNIFDSYLCLSMLRPHTGTVPYEGWSGAYSVSSILMQLQSFLFAEKIDQDGGYQANAQLSDQAVKSSINTCKKYKCSQCKHCHNTPWPKVKGPKEALIKVQPTDPRSGRHVVVQGSACQTTHTYWVGAYGEFGCNYGKIMYEAHISWIGDEWRPDNIRGGLCRFGFGSENAAVCGRCPESFGYDGCAMFSWNNQFEEFGDRFTKGDTITVAVDFNTQRIFFCKNGIMMQPEIELYVPPYLKGKWLFPLLSFKNSRAEFNFGSPKTPCSWLTRNGFKSLEQVAMEQGSLKQVNDDDDDNKSDDNNNVDWHSHFIIPELWVAIFEGLSVEEIFSAQFVCKQWFEIINKYNVEERSNGISCYYTKSKIGQSKGGDILGIGLSIKAKEEQHYGFDINSQMDILSLSAWKNGCRIGVWGEEITHFLPLVMNRKHAELADKAINYHLQLLSEIVYVDRGTYSNELERYIAKQTCLKLVDTLVAMMNQIVVQFVVGNEETDTNTVSMVMCEKVVLGYCALHHLLLYLVYENKKIVKHFANKTISTFIKDGSHKSITRDLGKLLIYLMISTKYDWNDIAQQFVEESFTRRVRWMMKQEQYAHYDTTNYVPGRSEDTYNASKTGRRLVMFQVWFMKNNASETLKGYNKRLGRPRRELRNAIVEKTKAILNSCSWREYFNELDLILNDESEVDAILRFSIYNSKKMGYHRREYNNNNRGGRGGYGGRGRGYNNYKNNNNTYNQHNNQYKTGIMQVNNNINTQSLPLPIYRIRAPIIRVKDGSKMRKNRVTEDNQIALKSFTKNTERGRGRGRGARGGRGRGRGRNYQSKPQQIHPNNTRAPQQPVQNEHNHQSQPVEINTNNPQRPQQKVAITQTNNTRPPQNVQRASSNQNDEEQGMSKAHRRKLRRKNKNNENNITTQQKQQQPQPQQQQQPQPPSTPDTSRDLASATTDNIKTKSMPIPAAKKEEIVPNTMNIDEKESNEEALSKAKRRKLRRKSGNQGVNNNNINGQSQQLSVSTNGKSLNRPTRPPMKEKRGYHISMMNKTKNMINSNNTAISTKSITSNPRKVVQEKSIKNNNKQQQEEGLSKAKRRKLRKKNRNNNVNQQ